MAQIVAPNWLECTGPQPGAFFQPLGPQFDAAARFAYHCPFHCQEAISQARTLSCPLWPKAFGARLRGTRDVVLEASNRLETA